FTRLAHPLQQKVDANDEPMYERWPLHVDGKPQHPRPLLRIPGLPDTIGSQETWLFIELLRRLDPRLEWQDIIMRIEPAQLPRTAISERKLKNRLQNNNSRLHYPLHNMVSWHVRGGSKRALQDRKNVLNLLSQDQKRRNTTRGATPGLIDPLLPDEPANRVPAVIYSARQNKPTGERALNQSQPQSSSTSSGTLQRIAAEARENSSEEKEPWEESDIEEGLARIRERAQKAAKRHQSIARRDAAVGMKNAAPALFHPPSGLRGSYATNEDPHSHSVAGRQPQSRLSSRELVAISSTSKASNGQLCGYESINQTNWGFDRTPFPPMATSQYQPDYRCTLAYPSSSSLSGFHTPYFGEDDSLQHRQAPPSPRPLPSITAFGSLVEGPQDSGLAFQVNNWDPYMNNLPS
ncbi:MAG: hypothetical protein Q9217_004686, partial [Psora testacea]